MSTTKIKKQIDFIVPPKLNGEAIVQPTAPVVVADTTARKLLATYDPDGPYRGMRVRETDTSNIYILDGSDVTDDANWTPDHIETFDSIVMPNGTRAEVDAKNAGTDPQAVGEPAVITDEDVLQFRRGDGTLFALAAAGGGGGLEGNSFVAVYGGGADAVANGTALKAAYAAAKALTPNGSALSATNRACVLVFPGDYALVAAGDYVANLTLDAQYVDLIGVGSSASNIIRGDGQLITQTANDVLIQGVTLKSEGIDYYDAGRPTQLAAYYPDSDLPLAKLVDVVMMNNSVTYPTRAGIEYSGTYTDCVCSGDYALGGGDEAGATFSGKAVRCVCGDKAFGGGTDGTFSGEARNCVGGNSSFGGDTFSGKAYNCTSGASSFGGTVLTAAGEVYDCFAGSDSFGMWFAGKAHRCIGGGACFGSWSGNSGTCVDCTASTDSFGTNWYSDGAGAQLSATARLLRCTAPAFPTPAAGGKRTLCIETTTSTVITD